MRLAKHDELVQSLIHSLGLEFMRGCTSIKPDREPLKGVEQNKRSAYISAKRASAYSTKSK